MMPPRSANRPRLSAPSGDDYALFNLIVILVGLGVGGYLAWTTFHGRISAGVIALRHREMLLLGHFTDRFSLADSQMMAANPNRVTLRALYGISHAVGGGWRIVGCGFLAALALACMVRAAPSRYKRAFDLDGLSREQARSFPAASAFLGRGLGLAPLEDGEPLPADHALTPEEWIARHALDGRGAYDAERARDALARQLGPRWTGPEHASPAARLLFVAFALHLQGRREDAIGVLGHASASLTKEGAGGRRGPAAPVDLPTGASAEIDRLLGNAGALPEAREVAAAHAWRAPALMSLLNAARQRHGVLAPSQFAWLRLVDRPLWYALHSLGFETEGVGRYIHPNPRAEAAGARDHWAVERIAGGPVIEPDLDRALAALRRHAPRGSGARDDSPPPRRTLPVRSAAAQAPADPASPETDDAPRPAT